MNAKSLTLQIRNGSFLSNRVGKKYRFASLPAQRVLPPRSHPELNASSFTFSEHEVIFLLQRNLMMK